MGPENFDKHHRFVKGNKGGGDPLVGKLQEYRACLYKTITPAKFKKLIKVILDKSMKGDMRAAKILVERILGKLPDGSTISVTNGIDGNTKIEIVVDNENNPK